MNITPYGETIFVLPDKVVDKTDSGIVLTDYTKKRPTSGTIIAIGEKVNFPYSDIAKTVYDALFPYWNCICNNSDYPETILGRAVDKITTELQSHLPFHNFKIGQRIIYGEFSGHKQTITWNGKDEEIFIMTPSDILALLK